MARKHIRVSRRILVVWLLLGSGIVFLAPQSVTGKMQLAFAGVFRWPLKVGRTISLSAQTERPSEAAIERTKRQYENHVDNLQRQLNDAQAQIDNLSGLRNRWPWDRACFVTADVSRLSLEGPRNELFINRGRDDGVYAGCFVLGDNSVVGVVAEAGGRTSRVRLVTDADSHIEVTVGDTGIHRILEGAGSGIARVQNVRTEYKVEAGAQVFACKNGGFLGSAVISGRVSAVKRSGAKPLEWDITVEPACKFEELADVAVVVMEPADKGLRTF